jgi:hypothetical protein
MILTNAEFVFIFFSSTEIWEAKYLPNISYCCKFVSFDIIPEAISQIEKIAVE